jgi:outer membrane protein assembly factor BamD (BamD/ComL family)
MTPFTKYLPHLGITALIIFLAGDYFSAEQTLPKQNKQEGSHTEGSHNEGEENLSQQEREHRMGIFHYNEANKSYKEGDFAAAIIDYKKALHHNKEFKQAIINLSTAYMKNKQFNEALKILQAGQKQFPKDPLIDYNFACYYSLTENLEPGLLALQKAVEKGYKQFEQMKTDPDLNNLRQSAPYKAWEKKVSTPHKN